MFKNVDKAKRLLEHLDEEKREDIFRIITMASLVILRGAERYGLTTEDVKLIGEFIYLEMDDIKNAEESSREEN